MTRLRSRRACLALMALGPALPARAQTGKPIRLLVPFPPGGATDITARVIAEPLGRLLGAPVIVENRAGAGGSVGMAEAARAAPDGTTLAMATLSTHGVNPAVYRKLPYDPVRDFTPITLATTSPLLLLAHASVPVGNIKEMTAWVRANAGRVNYGSSGNGSPPHLGMELLMSRLGLSMTHIPYKGIGPATAAQLGNEVQFAFTPVLVGLPQMKAGKLKAIASGAARRSAAVPDIPTVAESGVPGFDLSGWWGLLGPAKLPRARVDDLNAAVRRILEDGDVRRNLLAQGMDPSPTTPEAFAEIIRNDMQTWGALGRKLGVKLD